MEPVVKIIRGVIVLMCAALFLAGAVWNLCNPPQESEQMRIIAEAETMSQPESVEVLFQQEPDTEKQYAEKMQELENRVASMRMQRDASRQQLYVAVESLEFAEKQQKLQQYAEQQYQEQQLELLLHAKGLVPCLAVLNTEQANLIVPEALLQTEYEKLYDLVLRNTNYDEMQIVLVPLK